MQNEVDGMATTAPFISLVEISHQMGAQLIMLPFQIIELMKAIKQERPIHVMGRTKYVRPARKCRRNGIQHNVKAMKDKRLKSSFGYGLIEYIF